jgi:hypothetical protein
MMFNATKQSVSNRGIPPDSFLDELVAWGVDAPADIFADFSNSDGVFARVKSILGPYDDIRHRRAVMLEVMRVLAGFESSWNWNQGTDADADAKALKAGAPRSPGQIEAGAWQVSANSMGLGIELRVIVAAEIGSTGAKEFQKAMKENHPLAMEYIARLLNRTITGNGPLIRDDINKWLKRDAVAEFRGFLFPVAKVPGTP